MKISGKTKVLAIIGSPIVHSLSPIMHNTANRLVGGDYVYLGFNVKKGEGKKAVDAMRSLGIRGYNVTMPLKQEVIPYLDSITEEAKLMNAVNTIVNDNGILTGTNTDGYGMIKAIEKEAGVIQGSTLCIFGTGGAATAIGGKAAMEGAKKVFFVGRKENIPLNIEKLIFHLSQKYPFTKLSYGSFQDSIYLEKSVRESLIMVNATPLGMAPFNSETPLNNRKLITSKHIVADAVYHPRETRFLKEAGEEGARTVGGIEMLLWQGAKAFKLFTGEDMPVDKIRELVFNEE